MNKAIFFDKDGVLNSDNGINGTAEPARIFDNVENIIADLRKKGYKIFVITNQPIVARGLLKEEKLKKILEEFQETLLKMNPDAVIDKIYYCPHHPNANVEKYKALCECRKPKPGMLLQAAKEFKLDLKKSFMIGDRISDIIAGHLAGCTTIQVLTGMHEEKLIETDLKGIKEIKPDVVIKDIGELKNIIL